MKIFLICFLSFSAEAQYIVPTIGTGTFDDPKRAKYFADSSDTIQSCWMDFGRESRMLVVATRITFAQHQGILSHPDVLGLPWDVDNQIGGNAAAVASALESINIPADTVNPNLTYRELFRILYFVFSFAQRYNGQSGHEALFPSGRTLSTQFNQLSPAVRQYLRNTAESFNLDTSGMIGSMTLRQLLMSAVRQMRQRPVTVCGRSF